MSYLFRYAEQDVVESPWRIRQTGVYHRCSMPLDSESDLWIFLQPKQNSRFEQSLKTIMISQECSEGWLERCQKLEILLLSSYFGNWRWYLKDLSAEFEAIVSQDISRPRVSNNELEASSDMCKGRYCIDSRFIKSHN